MLVLALVGCQSQDLVDRAIFDARTLSRRCAGALADQQWDILAGESKRLELLAQRWDEYPPADPAKLETHRKLAKELSAAAAAIVEAAAKRDLAKASCSYGSVAERVGELRRLDTPALPPAALPSGMPPAALPMGNPT